jgi:hypothetical protein
MPLTATDGCRRDGVGMLLMEMPIYVVYILSSFRRALYIGVTSDLKRRTWQHRERLTAGWSG